LADFRAASGDDALTEQAASSEGHITAEDDDDRDNSRRSRFLTPVFP
jgi:hypothetical protein